MEVPTAFCVHSFNSCLLKETQKLFKLTFSAEKAAQLEHRIKLETKVLLEKKTSSENFTMPAASRILTHFSATWKHKHPIYDPKPSSQNFCLRADKSSPKSQYMGQYVFLTGHSSTKKKNLLTHELKVKATFSYFIKEVV